MQVDALNAMIRSGESCRYRFLPDVRNEVSLEQEFAAFANTSGGTNVVGVHGEVIRGFSAVDIKRINKLVVSASSRTTPFEVSVTTENIHADEMPANGLGPGNIDLEYFSAFFERTYGERLEQQVQPLPQTMGNMNLCNDGVLNLSGALLFARSPQYRLPPYIVKAIAYPGTDPDPETFLDSRDIVGKLADVFQQTLSFVLRNIGYHQDTQDLNSEGRPEIARIALEELIANSLIHRDYFVPRAFTEQPDR